MSARHPHQMALHAGRYAAHVMDEGQTKRLQTFATPFDIALARASTLSPDQVAANIEPATHAFNEFKAGRGNLDHWRTLVDALNVGEAIAKRHRIGRDHLEKNHAGQEALAAVYSRQRTSWTLRGTEIAALTDALWIWGVQVGFVSNGELEAARNYVATRREQWRRGGSTNGIRIVGLDDDAPAAVEVR